jgi:hypothetical protein
MVLGNTLGCVANLRCVAKYDVHAMSCLQSRAAVSVTLSRIESVRVSGLMRVMLVLFNVESTVVHAPMIGAWSKLRRKTLDALRTEG